MSGAHAGLLLVVFVRLWTTHQAGSFIATAISPADSLKKFCQTLRGHHPPPPRDTLLLDYVDTAFASWQIAGPLNISLPPGYSRHPYANVVYMQSVVRHPDALMNTGDYPDPPLRITEVVADAQVRPYRYDNSGVNAALMLNLDGRIWPYGYTAWRDLYTEMRRISVPTPTLIARDGTVLKPVEVYPIVRINTVSADPYETTVEIRHLSPIVWRFDSDGTPSNASREWRPDYVIERTSFGVFVSWMPPFPSVLDTRVGIAVLEKKSASDSSVHQPSWWQADEALRKLIVEHADISLRQQALADLERLHPRHPMLPHFRIVTQLGTREFSDLWLRTQQASCDVSTWYLLRYVHVSWESVRMLQCYRLVRDRPVSSLREYIDANIVIRFRDDDDAQLRSIAADIVQHSFMGDSSRAFNYAPTDFSELWLERVR